MRNWLKKLILECLKETLKHEALIISSRAPTSGDVYGTGSLWKFEQEFYKAKKVTTEWERIT